jgi:hypothetical protein
MPVSRWMQAVWLHHRRRPVSLRTGLATGYGRHDGAVAIERGPAAERECDIFHSASTIAW